MINGILNIDKPAGFTSHDVVAKMRGICGQKKIGHTGTLDPQAVGVLPVCLGNATKVCDMLADRDKEYVAELLLGVSTDTQDTTGKLLREIPVGEDTFTQEAVRKVVMGFPGNYEQLPPMYSALKINGKKLYELAREGREVERKRRSVVIHDLEILEMRLPIVRFRVECSKGTYIRTLCADIGERLGCGGAMKSLLRTRVGGFLLRDAISLQTLQELKDAGRLEEAVLPTDSVFAEHPALHVSAEWGKLLENGNPFLPEQSVEKTCFAPGQWVRVYGEDDVFAAIYAYEKEMGRYKPVKMFLEV